MKIHGEGTPDIIQYSPYRTGSTMVYQYLKNLFPDKKILKYHAYRDEQVPVVITVRDFRDAVISWWRIEYGEDIKLGESFITKADIDNLSDAYFELDKIMHKYLVTHNNVLVLKYELFYNDFEYLHNAMSAFFGIDISEEDRKRIESKCNIKYNKKFQEKYDGFSEYSVETGIHGDHIFTGESIYDQVTPDNLKEYFTEKLSVLLKNWNYI